MRTFACPYLAGNVELTDEREEHIALNHPDLLPEHLAQLGETLARPDEVRRSLRMSAARVFYRWFADVRHSKHVAVVVVSDPAGQRHWIITAYITRRIANGEIEWSRS